MTDAQRQLINSAKRGNSDGVNTAVSDGAVLDQHEIGGRSAVHHAAAAGHHLTLAAILRAGADPNLKSFLPDDDGGRALHLAGEGGHCEAVRTLVNNGADTKATDNKGRTAVHWAALRAQLDALRALQEVGCDLRAKVQGRANALHFAVASGDLEVVRFLVEEGVSKEQKDKNNKLPSDVAKLKGYKDIHYYLKDRTSHLAPPSPSGTLTRKKDELRFKDQQIIELQSKLAQLELEKSQPEDEAQELREQQLKGARREDGVVEAPQDIHQQLQLLSHQNRDYKKKLTRAEEEVRDLKQRLEERRDQHEYEQEQDSDDIHQHLQIVSQQNREYRKKLIEQEGKEAELVQRSAADRQTIQELREEIEKLKQELKQSHDTIGSWEQRGAMEKEASTRVVELTEEVQHLTYLLDQAGKTAFITQEMQQKKVAEAKMGEEAKQREVEDLKQRLKQAEDTTYTLQSEAKERDERSQQIITGLKEEVATVNTQLQRHQQLQQQLQQQIQQQHQLQQQLHHQLQREEHQHQQQQPSQDIQQVQRVVQELREKAAANHQTITALRHQLDAAKRHAPQPLHPQHQQAITPQMLQDQRRLQELTARDENNRETITRLNAKIMEMTDRLKQYEKAVYGYKIRLGERERELRQSEENKQTVVDLREEVRKLTDRLAMMRQRAASARNSLISEEE